LWQVALEERAHEFASPIHADLLGSREVGARKATASPEAIQAVDAGLVQGHGSQFLKSDPTRE